MDGQPTAPNYLPATSTTRSKATPKRAGETLDSARELIARLGPEQRKSVPDLPPGEDKAMTGVFTRMKSIYNHLWSSNFKTEDQLKVAKIEWLKAFRIIRATPKEVEATLDYCATRNVKMPNLPEFIVILREVRRGTRVRKADPGQLMIAETPEQATQREAHKAAEKEKYRQIAQQHMAGLKGMFTGET